MLLASLKKDGQEILNKAENIAKQEKIEFEKNLAEIKPFNGRVAEKVIRTATVPVLLIRGNQGA